MSAHPADTAKPGDAFHDEAGHTWVMDPDYNTPWFTPIQVAGRSWHTTAEARERTLTPLVPSLTHEGVDPIKEWKAAADDRMKVAELLGVDCAIDAILDAILRMQHDLDPKHAGTPAAIAGALRTLAASETEYKVTVGGVKMAKVDAHGQTETERIVDRLRKRLGTAEWLLAEAKHYVLDYERLLDTITEQLDCGRYEQIPDAINQAQGDLPTPDASDPTHLRYAAAICEALWEDTDREVMLFLWLDAVRVELLARADRLDVDAADRELAGSVIAEHFPTHEVPAIADFVLAGIRAGRDAERGA